MLKKAGIVVLGATAGMISLAPLASAGESHDHDRDGHRSHSSSDCGATAYQGGQNNDGDQLVGVNNVNVQAPINQVGVLSRLDSDCDDDDRDRGHGRHKHDRHGHDRHHDDEDGRGGGATAIQRGQNNSGNQLIGVNNVNAQLPINQLGILSVLDD